jgi:hypothetical protein
MATATCDERLVVVLLEHGADPSHANAHGWTALHQAAYSGLPALAQILLDAGASVDASARGDGGTPLVIALFWGHRDTAELLSRHGIVPGNLRVAAALGRLDLIKDLVASDGRLAPPAGAHRDFYRPHSGFPPWQPSRAGGRRPSRLLSPTQRLSILATVRRSPGDPRRGADVVGAQRPG